MNGFTGSRKYELAGIVQYGSGYAPCTCGGYLHWINSESGTTYEHSTYVAPWKQHIAVPPGGTVEISIV